MSHEGGGGYYGDAELFTECMVIDMQTLLVRLIHHIKGNHHWPSELAEIPMRYPRFSASSTIHSKVPQAECTSTATSRPGSWLFRSA